MGHALDAGDDREVDALVVDPNNEPAKDLWVHLKFELDPLALLQHAAERFLDLVNLFRGQILGRGHGGLHMALVGADKAPEIVGDLENLAEAAVLGHRAHELHGLDRAVHVRQGGGDGLRLVLLGDGRVHEVHRGVGAVPEALHDLVQVRAHRVENAITNSSAEEGCGVTATDPKKTDWRLNRGFFLLQGSEPPCKNCLLCRKRLP
mmetsp:Transcript_26007/g.61876  ORF Transcript_26007/g.61876 Transcript_26007/m.61876 type:complete len:206 (-) Transcript_26007:173-790(-)